MDRSTYNNLKYQEWLNNPQAGLFNEDDTVFDIMKNAGQTLNREELVQRFMEKEEFVKNDKQLASSLVQEAILKLLNKNKIICVEYGFYGLARRY